jgi:hypothetical protein
MSGGGGPSTPLGPGTGAGTNISAIGGSGTGFSSIPNAEIQTALSNPSIRTALSSHGIGPITGPNTLNLDPAILSSIIGTIK